MPSDDTEAARPDARRLVDDYGRLRICSNLLITISRNWKVDSDPSLPPQAPIKAIAPLAKLESDTRIERYIAAVANFDALWLGFEGESSGDESYLIIPDYNGVNLLTGTASEPAAEAIKSNHFILLPDQPWIDFARDSTGNYQQILPRYASAATSIKDSGLGEIGGEMFIRIYPVDNTGLQSSDFMGPELPMPYYGKRDTMENISNDNSTVVGEDNRQNSGEQRNINLWPRRQFTENFVMSDSCGELAITLVTPENFSRLTGDPLLDHTFDETLPLPESEDPF